VECARRAAAGFPGQLIDSSYGLRMANITFEELGDSPRERYTADGMSARRRLLVAWEDRHAMVIELLAQGYPPGLPAGYPGAPGVVAMEVQVEPWPPAPDAQGPLDDVTEQINSFTGKYALLTVDYQLLVWAAGRPDLPSAPEGTVLTYRMDFGGEYMVLGGQNMYWHSDPTLPVPPEAVPTLRVPVVEHQITWHRVVAPPWEAIRRCVGAVNAGPFLGAAAETVLLDGATAQRQLLGLDSQRQPQLGWRIVYLFRERTVTVGGQSYGWNHRYRCLPQQSPGWDRLVDGAGNPLYRTADFTPLFQMETLP